MDVTPPLRPTPTLVLLSRFVHHLLSTPVFRIKIFQTLTYLLYEMIHVLPWLKMNALNFSTSDSISFKDISTLSCIENSAKTNDSTIAFMDTTGPALENAIESPSTVRFGGSFSHLMNFTCCEHRCVASLSLLDIEQCRTSFKSRSRLICLQFHSLPKAMLQVHTICRVGTFASQPLSIYWGYLIIAWAHNSYQSHRRRKNTMTGGHS